MQQSLKVFIAWFKQNHGSHFHQIWNRQALSIPKFVLIFSLCIWTSIASYSQCDVSATEEITFSLSGQNANISTTSFLVDASDVVVAITDSNTFPTQTAGAYQLYAVNYDNTQTINLPVIGEAMTSLSGICYELSAALNLTVCPVITPTDDCHFCSGEDILINASGGNISSEYLTNYVLVSETGVIEHISNSTNLGTASVGSYDIYALNFKIDNPVSGLTVGADFDLISGVCLEIGTALNVNICEVPSLTIDSTPESCGNSNGSASLSIMGGQAAYTYAWSNGASTSVNSDLVAGMYTVVVTDANGCTDEGQVTVLATAAPSAPVLEVSQNVCPSTIGSFSLVTACEGSTTQYSTDNGGTWTSTMPVWSDGVTLLARCVDTDGCVSAVSNSVTATAVVCCTAPNSPVIAVTDNVCGDDTGSFIVVTACESGAALYWSANNGATWTTTAPVYNTNISITTIARCESTTISGCVSAASVAISSQPQATAPSAPVLEVSQNVCPSNEGSFSLVTACEGSTTEYSTDNGGTWTSTMPVWSDGVTLLARCVDTNGCPSAVSNSVTATQTICLVDLALIKTLNGNTAGIESGDEVSFSITVINQGDVPAYDIGIVDYIPQGMTFTGNNWGLLNGNATFTITSLAPQTQTTIEILLTVDADFEGNAITNYAEISRVSDVDGNPIEDIDSTPDTVNDDTLLNNDEVNGNANLGEDEDDHDSEMIGVNLFFDLSLTKQLSPTQSTGLSLGDEVDYIIEVSNEGTINGYNIRIEDQLPIGLLLADADWQTENGKVFYMLDSLTVGNTVSIEITCQIDPTFTGGQIRNIAEIAAVTDKDEGSIEDDIDSTPGEIDEELMEDDIDDEILDLCLEDVTVSEEVTICQGEQTVLTTSIARDDVVFSWSPVLGLDDPTAANPVASPSTSTNYEVTATYANCTKTAVVRVIVNPSILIAADVKDIDCCDLGSIDLRVEGGSSPYQYDWNPAVSTTGLASDLDSGTYSVTITDAQGCSEERSYTIMDTCNDCIDYIDEIEIVLTVGELATFCTGIRYPERDIYEVLLDGSSYEAPMVVCEKDPIIFYTYALTVNEGQNGPYMLDYWTYNGVVVENMMFQTMDELVTIMNANDPMGNWRNNPNTYTISGGDSETIEDYGNMSITHMPTNIQATIQKNFTNITQGTSIEFLATHVGEFVFAVKSPDCCTDEVTITVIDNVDCSTLNLTSLSTAANCCNEQGSINFSASGGVAPYLYTWENNISSTNSATNLSAGTYRVTVTDANDCIAVGQATIESDCLSCPNLFANTTLTFTTDEDASVCMNANFGAYSIYDIIIDGSLYTQPETLCATEPVIFYTYAPTINQGQQGPYRIDFWQCNNVIVQNVVVQDMHELVALMNAEDPNGDWVNNVATFSISGSEDGSTNQYGNLIITHLPSNIQSTMMTNYTSIGRGYFIDVPNVEGTYTVEVTNTEDCCTDVITVIVEEADDGGINPATPIEDETVYYTTPYETPLTDICMPVSKFFQDDLVSITVCSAPSNGIVSNLSDGDACLDYTPNDGFSGVDEFCIEVCNEAGICGQITIIVTVPVEVGGGFDPSTPTDGCDGVYIYASTAFNTPLTNQCLPLFKCFSEDLASLTICGAATNGQVVLNDTDECIDYIPNVNFSGIDQFCVEACSVEGICTDFIMEIGVGQGQNNNVVVTGANHQNMMQNTSLEVCLEITELSSSPILFSTCNNPSNGSIATGVGAVACVIYTPEVGFIGTDEFCAILCDETGVCDTTMVYIDVMEDESIACGTVVSENDIISNTCNGAYGQVCLDLSLEEISNLTILDNGQTYTGGIAGCDPEEILTYLYLGLPETSEGYTLVSWVANNSTITNMDFNTLADLIVLMNNVDANNEWVLHEQSKTISSSIVSGGEFSYGALVIRNNSTTELSELAYNVDLVPNGLKLSLTAGMHELEFITDEGCSDKLSLTIDCEGTTTTGNTTRDCDDIDGYDGSLILQANSCEERSNICLDFNTGDIYTYVNGAIHQNISTCNNGTGSQIRLYPGEYNIEFVNSKNGCKDQLYVEINCTMNLQTLDTDKPIAEDKQKTLEEPAIKVYTGFSPNNDGINDAFHIEGLSAYPDAILFVFNRKGNKVFQSVNYKNDWQGTKNGENLENGTYFYVLDLKNGTTDSGYLQIMR